MVAQTLNLMIMEKIPTKNVNSIFTMLPMCDNPSVTYDVTKEDITCTLTVAVEKHLIELLPYDSRILLFGRKNKKNAVRTYLQMSKTTKWGEYHPNTMRNDLAFMWNMIRYCTNSAAIKYHQIKQENLNNRLETILNNQQS